MHYNRVQGWSVVAEIRNLQVLLKPASFGPVLLGVRLGTVLRAQKELDIHIWGFFRSDIFLFENFLRVFCGGRNSSVADLTLVINTRIRQNREKVKIFDYLTENPPKDIF